MLGNLLLGPQQLHLLLAAEGGSIEPVDPPPRYGPVIYVSDLCTYVSSCSEIAVDSMITIVITFNE